MSEDDNPTSPPASVRFAGGFIKGLLESISEIGDRTKKEQQELELAELESKARREEKARREAGTFVMKTHQLIVRDRDRVPHLIEFKYEYIGTSMSEQEALERMDSELRDHVSASYPPYSSRDPQLEGARGVLAHFIARKDPILHKFPESYPRWFADTLYITRIEPVPEHETVANEAYTLEDRARDLHALIQKEQRLREQFADMFTAAEQGDKKSQEFCEDIIQKLHEEKLTIMCRILTS